jgi:hypothetical protein
MLEVPEVSALRWPGGPGTPAPQVHQAHDNPYPCPQPVPAWRAQSRGRALKETVRYVIQKPCTTPSEALQAPYSRAMTRLMPIPASGCHTAILRPKGVKTKPSNPC